MKRAIASISLAIVIAALGAVVAPVAPWSAAGVLAAEEAAGLRYRVVVDGMT